jgi:hypothetical protein
MEPPTGFEPVTYALREARDTAPGPLPALIATRLPPMHSAHGVHGVAGPRPGPRPSHLWSNRLLLAAGRRLSPASARRGGRRLLT